MTTALLTSSLRQHGLYATRARQLVFDRLRDYGPLSLPRLVQLCTPDINKSSVYRTVQTFEAYNLIQRSWDGWQPQLQLSELFLPHRHYLACLGCGLQYGFDDELLQGWFEQISRHSGFSITQHQIELSGHCPQCQLHT